MGGKFVKTTDGYDFTQTPGSPYRLKIAATPFNDQSSRVQTIHTFKKGEKTVLVVDMAGNEDPSVMYRKFMDLPDNVDVSQDIRALLECITTTGRDYPILEKSKRYRSPRTILKDYGPRLLKLATGDATFNGPGGKKISFESDLSEYTKSGLYDYGPLYNRGLRELIPEKFRWKSDKGQGVHLKYAMLCYIAARISEGVYITSTIRAMVKFMLYRKNSPENNPTNQAEQASRTGQLTRGIGGDTETNKFISTLTKRISSGGESYYVSLKGEAYTNHFVMKLATMSNIALFPVINNKSELSNATYNAVRALVTKTNNTN